MPAADKDKKGGKLADDKNKDKDGKKGGKPKRKKPPPKGEQTVPRNKGAVKPSWPPPARDRVPVAAYNRGPMNVRHNTRGIVMGGRAMMSQMPSAMVNAQHAMDNFRRETANEISGLKTMLPGMKEEIAKLEGVVNQRVGDVQTMLQQRWMRDRAFGRPAPPEESMVDATAVLKEQNERKYRTHQWQLTQALEDAMDAPRRQGGGSTPINTPSEMSGIQSLHTQMTPPRPPNLTDRQGPSAMNTGVMRAADELAQMIGGLNIASGAGDANSSMAVSSHPIDV